MTKKDFVALADMIRADSRYSEYSKTPVTARTVTVETLARFCAAQNPKFDRARWLAYVNGEQNGGKRKRNPLDDLAATLNTGTSWEDR